MHAKRPGVGGRRNRRGFTLVELVVVVGIIAILLSVAGYQVTRSRRRVTLERAVVDLQGRLAEAQSLAAVAGSRLGPHLNAPRLVYAGNCPVAAGQAGPDHPQLWISFNGNTAEIPTQITYDPATDELTAQCETFDVAAVTQAAGAFNEPAAPVTFAFSPSGRLIGAPSVYVEVGSATDNKTYGMRILPSGIMCPASTLGGPLCDEDAGP